jgi:hypothetical protein
MHLHLRIYRVPLSLPFLHDRLRPLLPVVNIQHCRRCGVRLRQLLALLRLWSLHTLLVPHHPRSDQVSTSDRMRGCLLTLDSASDNALVLASDVTINAELHWQLLPFDPARGKPQLYFDVMHEPNLIRIFNKYMRPLMPDDKHKLAANTPLKEMIIRCAPLPLPVWDIRVRRSDRGPLRCVDVFEAIYKSLSTPLSDAEKSQWAQDYLDSCQPYFHARCKASAALTDWEELQGLRRVDMLKGRTRFMGIARASPGKNYWVLHLDRPR